MAETLGSLIDKLTITQLKNYHADTSEKKESTANQILMLTSEIDEYINNALEGNVKYIEFPQNKVYKKHTVEVGSPTCEMSFGELALKLLEVNAKMWSNQALVYDFHTVPADEHVDVINRCTTLNIERNEYIDAINRWLAHRLKWI